MRNRSIKILSLIVLLASFIPMEARTVRNFKCSSEGCISFVIDSVDYRADLTRVYGKIKGRPHTANRIDLIEYVGSKPSEKYVWTDIDGVDMKRWFQWEDSGEIAVEIDFPAIKRCKPFTLMLTGPKGNSIWKIVK